MWSVERYVQREEVKVVPICAMVGERLSGGKAPLIFKLGSIWMWVVRLSALATLLPDKKLDLEAGWALELVWMFCRRDSSVAAVKIWTPVYILVTVLNMPPHIGLKEMQKSVLINWDGRIGLDVFHLWQEFLEGFSERGNFPWSSVKGNFLQ
jgi:hypothetical protein